VIVDTSVWIEFLRPGASSAGAHLAAMIEGGDDIVVPEIVMLELLSGTGDETLAATRQRMLEAFDVVPLAPLADSLRAAAVQRACRRGGRPVRSLGDCLVAATALRVGIPVVHCDRDFEVIADHAGLATVSLLPH
jgi:predicted nucleic acid-binding protein